MVYITHVSGRHSSANTPLSLAVTQNCLPCSQVSLIDLFVPWKHLRYQTSLSPNQLSPIRTSLELRSQLSASAKPNFPLTQSWELTVSFSADHLQYASPLQVP